MGFFNKDKKEAEEKKGTKEASKSKAKKKVSTNKKVEKKEVITRIPSNERGKTFDAVIFPWITEKTHEMISSGKYVFKVESRCNKNHIKNAVEVTYDVKVENVNVINIHAKKRRFGRVIGKKSGYKKAVVTLKKGDKIDFFQGA